MQIKKMFLTAAIVVMMLSACSRTNEETAINKEVGTNSKENQKTGSEKEETMTEKNTMSSETTNYNAESNVWDVINDPVFEDYGRLIFPVDITIEDNLKLKNVSSILPWYSEVNTEKTVEIVNYMKNQVTNGNQIFYNIYSEEEIKADSEKRDTGLFFFRGDTNAKTAITNAGGGFVYVAGIHDSFPHALELSKKGYNAFALIYRPGAQTACENLARAIAFLNEHAKELQIDMTDYSLWGGSAGARMSAWLGSYGTAYFGEEEYPAPATVIMQYTGLSQITGDEPPTYACVGTSDGIASYRSMENYISKIKQNGTNAEIEVFNGLSHGFGLGEGTVAEGWIDHAVAFWEENMNDLRNGSSIDTVTTPDDFPEKYAYGSGKISDYSRYYMLKKMPEPDENQTVLNTIADPDDIQVLYLWEEGNVPAQTEFTEDMTGYFDDPDFRPYVTAIPVRKGVQAKGAVVLMAGGAYEFRGNYTDALPTAAALREHGFQTFIVDYRLHPYIQEEGALDVARAVRFVRKNADVYGINPDAIAVMGFSAGGIQAGEFLMHYDEEVNGTALDKSYVPDELDQIPAHASAAGMIYSFYGRLSVGNMDEDWLSEGNLPPTYYVYGTEDPRII